MYGDEHTHGSAVSLPTAMLLIIWMYLICSVGLNIAFTVGNHFYIFIVPGVLIVATVCYQGVMLLDVLKI